MTRRTFGAAIAPESVTLVEYCDERSGVRVLDEWKNATRSASVDESVEKLADLVARTGAREASVAVALEQFGVFHHTMTLPASAADDVVRPIVLREVQRVFGVTDPVVAFDREPESGEVFIAGSPRDTMGAIAARLGSRRLRVRAITVVPRAMRALYEASGGSYEPTALLICLESGPQLAFFLEGKLELAIDPPIALEGGRPSIADVLDQVERGSVYFRQQFRGATATRILLAARASEYEPLAAALGQRLRARVKPLFAAGATPESVVAMGAVLEAHRPTPLDLFPHPPTLQARARAVVRGPNRFVAASAVLAATTLVWAMIQFAALASARRETRFLQDRARAMAPVIAPLREIAERRADVATQAAFVRDAHDEHLAVTSTLAALGSGAPASVRFDSLLVSRAAPGWHGVVVGTVSAPTTAAAVRDLDAFLAHVRASHLVADAVLDDFDYPPPPTGDSTSRAASVVIVFHLSFGVVPRAAGAGARTVSAAMGEVR